MRKFSVVVAALSMAVVLTGCQAEVERKQEMMAAAGFKVKIANTPERVAELAKLPSQRFTMMTVKSRAVLYLYADPVGCKCVYYGGEEAYGAYQRIAQAQAIADKQLMAARMMQDASWNWGTWGPGWGPYGRFY